MIDTFTLYILYRTAGYDYVRKTFSGLSRVAMDRYEDYYRSNYEIINIGWEEDMIR